MSKTRFTKPQLKMLQRARNAECNGEIFKVAAGRSVYVAERLRSRGLLVSKPADGLGYGYALTERGRFVADEQGIGAGGRITQLFRYTFNKEALDALDGEKS